MYAQLETVYETVEAEGEEGGTVTKEKYTDEGLIIKKDPEYPNKPVYPKPYNGPKIDNSEEGTPLDNTFQTKYGFGRPVGGWLKPSGGAKSFGVKGQGNQDLKCFDDKRLGCVPIPETDREKSVLVPHQNLEPRVIPGYRSIEQGYCKYSYVMITVSGSENQKIDGDTLKLVVQANEWNKNVNFTTPIQPGESKLMPLPRASEGASYLSLAATTAMVAAFFNI